MGHTGKHLVKSEAAVYIRGTCKQRKGKKERLDKQMLERKFERKKDLEKKTRMGGE